VLGQPLEEMCELLAILHCLAVLGRGDPRDLGR
jgi:hypothetical protein